MNERDATAVILAAGKGTRMKSDLPKVLIPVAGRAMLLRVISSVRRAGIPRIVTVVGHQAQRVAAALPSDVLYVEQREQLGTAHALAQAAPLCPRTGSLLVLCGDTPLLAPGTLASLVERRERTGAWAVMLTAVLDNPSGYGRVVRDGTGSVRGVVEHRDADEATLAVREVNTGVYCFDASRVFEELGGVDRHNAQSEYYLPDVLRRMLEHGGGVETVTLSDPREALGVNTPEQLARAEAVLNRMEER